MHSVEEDILDLDIGGTHKLTTTKKTLTKFEGSVLAAMFSGRHHLLKHKDRIFIDRDGEAFSLMLNYLRTGQKPVFEDQSESDNLVYFRGKPMSQQESLFYRELHYWQIPTSEESIHLGKDDLVILDQYQFNEFDEEWTA